MTQLFIDFDGTVADFDPKALEILGMPAWEYEAIHKAKGLWKALRDYRDENGLGFFESLHPMHDAHHLVNSVRHVDPLFLTGCPFGHWAPIQKNNWGNRVFPNIPVITCMAKDKHLHMKAAGDIIIDDREKHREAWENAGGIWITHTSAEESLRQLREIMPRWFY